MCGRAMRFQPHAGRGRYSAAMTLLLNQALRAAHTRAARPVGTAASVLVAGGGGTLGSAVLERLLARRAPGTAKVLATRRLTTALHGLAPVIVDGSAAPSAWVTSAALADTALVVFDRERHATGRERTVVRPAPETLSALAGWLHACGVRTLIVVLPHAPASLPGALKAGLANLDEQATAAIGFERLVFVRTAQAPAEQRARRWAQRVADGLLAQMRLMVAASGQPVRAAKVAQFVVELVAQLPSSAPGTRVAPPELVWQAAQERDPAPLVRAWLEARELPPPRAPRPRL